MISCDPCNPTSEEVCYCLLLALTTPTLSHPTSANPRFLIPPLTEEMNLSDPENFPSPLFRSQLCGARRVGRISSVILRAPEPSNGVWQRCPSRLARTCCWRFLVFPLPSQRSHFISGGHATKVQSIKPSSCLKRVKSSKCSPHSVPSLDLVFNQCKWGLMSICRTIERCCQICYQFKWYDQAVKLYSVLIWS